MKMLVCLAAFALPGLAVAAGAQPMAPRPSSPPVAHPQGMPYALYAQKTKAKLLRLDLNHDGRISRDEFAQRPRRPQTTAEKAMRGFDRLDLNHDGFIDAQELDAFVAKRFARADLNHDGVVTEDERDARRAERPRR